MRTTLAALSFAGLILRFPLGRWQPNSRGSKRFGPAQASPLEGSAVRRGSLVGGGCWRVRCWLVLERADEVDRVPDRRVIYELIEERIWHRCALH